MIRERIIEYKLIVIAGLLSILMVLGLSYYFLAEPKVDVKIYKHTESGNYIYCETGTLTNEFHTYEGEGRIAESKAVAC